jgi:hypothetical protein
MMGATAAMALPPQIAVPAAISSVVFFSTFKSFPRTIPPVITRDTEMSVCTKPLLDAVITSSSPIPKPRSTIDTCRILDVYR